MNRLCTLDRLDLIYEGFEHVKQFQPYRTLLATAYMKDMQNALMRVDPKDRNALEVIASSYEEKLYGLYDVNVKP